MNDSLQFRCRPVNVTLIVLALAAGCGTHSTIGLQVGHTGGATVDGGLDSTSSGGNAGPSDGVAGAGGFPSNASDGAVLDASGGVGGTFLVVDGGASGAIPGTGGAGGLGGGNGSGAVGGQVFCSLGSGTPDPAVRFLAAAEYPTHPASYLYPVAMGDLNGDGRPDVAVANAFDPDRPAGVGGTAGSLVGSVSVYLNGPNGVLASAHDYPAGVQAEVVATGDLNGDGKIDLAVTTAQGVSILLNNGGGAFGTPASFSTGIGPKAVALGDVNGDGKIDLIVANNGRVGRSGMEGGDIAVLTNLGSGAFVASNFPAGSSPVAVALGDVNGDDKPDIAVASGDSVSLLLNSGSGTFTPAVSYGAGTTPTSIALGDLNGDGKLDMAISKGFLLNLGNGTFSAAVNYFGGAVVLGDVNGDGKLDVIAGGTTYPCGVVVWPNTGSGTFGVPVGIAAPINLSVAVGDMNGDGLLDLVLPSGDGIAVILHAPR